MPDWPAGPDTDDDLPTLRAGRWTDGYVEPDAESAPDTESVPDTRQAPEAEPRPSSEESPPRRDSRRIVALTLVLALLGLATGYVATVAVLDARRTNTKSTASPPAPTSPTSPASPATPSDPDAAVLGGLIMQQTDVPHDDVVMLVENGTDAVHTATLDLCNGKYPSETQRTARRQVVVDGPNLTTGISTEAVLYHEPAGSEQAFRELRAVTAACPPRPVTSPVGEPTITTKFNAPPDKDWPSTPTVERLAYDLTTIEQGQPSRTIAVYLRRGRVLMGIYFPSTGVQTAVGGKTTVPAIVQVFAQRMAALPASVVNG
jgi:hypothetical protein